MQRSGKRRRRRPGRDVVNIGYSGPLSGGAANYGRNVQSGLQLAVAELNEAGGLEIRGCMVRTTKTASLRPYIVGPQVVAHGRYSAVQ
jgi:branched-chain amino acid transport system substrate-binding protein